MKAWISLPIVIVLIFLFGCTSQPKKIAPEEAPPSAQSQLAVAQQELTQSKEAAAVAKLNALIKAHPNSDVADSSLMILGRLNYTKKRYAQAHDYFLKVINSPIQSPNEAQAYLGSTLCLIKLGHVDEALAMSQRGLQSKNLNQKTAHELHQLRFSLAKDLGDLKDSLISLSYLIQAEPNSQKALKLKSSGYPILNKMDTPTLKALLVEDIHPEFKSFCSFRVGLSELQAGRRSDAQDYFQESYRLAPESTYGIQSQKYLEQLSASQKVNPRTIGVALPLSGRYESVSQKVLKGMQLGLGIFGPNSSNFKIAVRDSGTTLQEASLAAEDLILKDHVIAITGSLLSKTAPEISKRANEYGVPSIHMTQASSLTELGPLVFQNSINSKHLVNKLVDVAMTQMGKKRFAILFPNDAYGVEYANLFWDEVVKRGGTIAAAQSYDPKETDFRDSIKRMVGTYYVEDRQAEYKARMNNWLKDKKSARAREDVPEDLLPPIVNFDALFVADGPRAVGQIVPMLAYVGVKDVQLIGTNLWNSQDFIRRGQKGVEGAVFVDAAINFSDQLSRSGFYKEYMDTFGEAPGIFEAQGYETAAILRQLIDRGATGRDSLANSLSRLGSFSTIGGQASMSEDRQIVKPLVPLTIKDGQIIPL